MNTKEQLTSNQRALSAAGWLLHLSGCVKRAVERGEDVVKIVPEDAAEIQKSLDVLEEIGYSSVSTADEPSADPRALIENVVGYVTQTSDRIGFARALQAIELALTKAPSPSSLGNNQPICEQVGSSLPPSAVHSGCVDYMQRYFFEVHGLKYSRADARTVLETAMRQPDPTSVTKVVAP